MTAAGRATYDDLLALPEDVRAELIDGVVHTWPTPLPLHARVKGALAHRIGGPFDDDDGYGGPGGWWIIFGVDVRLSPHDVFCPDLSGWRRERWTCSWDVRPIDIVPDWVCEITSPHSARFDRVTKAKRYLEAGVPALWLIDPETRVLEALVREGDKWLEAGRFSDGDVVRIPPFEAIELEVARLFPPPPAETP